MILEELGTCAESVTARPHCDYSAHCDQYLLKQKVFDRQYADFYCTRLRLLRQRLEAAVAKKWGGNLPIKKVCEITPEEDCVVIGTLFKQMELQPSILKELSDQLQETPLPPRERFFTDCDQLFLEDELQRIALSGQVSAKELVTGVVVAMRGREKEVESGVFFVEDYCSVGLAEQSPLPALEDDRYVMFVSGLNVGGKAESALERQLLTDYLWGNLTGVDSDFSTASKVCHVVVAGNCLAQETQDNSHLQKAKYLTKKSAASSVEPAKMLDSFVLDLVTTVPVTLMPGEFDPSNFQLPQQPLHRCLFPLAAAAIGGSLCLATNPNEFTVNGVRFLGTSGQNVTNIFQYSAMDDCLLIMERMLRWSHMAPTAPDTLGSYPFTDSDPFIINNCPHIFFAGNQPRCLSRVIQDDDGKRVLLLAVPSFSETGSCALVNLRTLECQPLCFCLH